MRLVLIGLIILLTIGCNLTRTSTNNGNSIDRLLISNEADLKSIEKYSTIDLLEFRGINLDQQFCIKLNQIDGSKINTLQFIESNLKRLDELKIQFDVEFLGIVFCDSVPKFDSSLFQGSFGNKILISQSSLIDSNSFVSSICSFKELKFLELSVLGLNKLPECIKDLTYIESLRIGQNSYKEIPIQIRTLPNLKKLDISFNQYPLKYPCWLSKLDNLCGGSTKAEERRLREVECLKNVNLGYWTD